MDRIDPSNFQVSGQPGTTPPARPNLLGRVYAPVSPASGTPAVRREELQQEGTLARIGPVLDSFESTGAPRASRASGVSAAPASSAPTPKVASLVAARVPGTVDFTEPASAGRAATNDAPQSVPMYRHPADRNTVATAVHAGRILDVNG